MRRPWKTLIPIMIARATCFGLAFWFARELVWWKRFIVIVSAGIWGALGCGGTIETQTDAGDDVVEAGTDALELDAAADVVTKAPFCTAPAYGIQCGAGGFTCTPPASTIPILCTQTQCAPGWVCTPTELADAGDGIVVQP